MHKFENDLSPPLIDDMFYSNSFVPNCKEEGGSMVIVGKRVGVWWEYGKLLIFGKNTLKFI